MLVNREPALHLKLIGSQIAIKRTLLILLTSMSQNSSTSHKVFPPGRKVASSDLDSSSVSILSQ